MFCGCLVHFLVLIPVPWLNQHCQQFVSYTFYHFLVSDPQCWFDQSSVSNFFNNNRDQLLFTNFLIHFFASKLFSWCKTFIKSLSSLMKTIVFCYCLELHNSDMSVTSRYSKHLCFEPFVPVYNKKFELMLMRRVKACSSSGSVV